MELPLRWERRWPIKGAAVEGGTAGLPAGRAGAAFPAGGGPGSWPGAHCPAGVDMATYKSEALHQRYRGKLRPIRHYALGWLPRWSRLVTAVPASI